VLFSHYPYFDAAVDQALAGAYYEHQRESWVRIQGSWVPYPFQNNVRYLSDVSRSQCVDGLRKLFGDPAQAGNFREWMDAVFGEGIVRYFMEPYNRKVWGVPLETMSKAWIAERVSVVDLARIERNIAEPRADVSWGPTTMFKFPKHGGTGAIYSGIAKNFSEQIAFNHEMVAVDPVAKQVTFANGLLESYDILINTTPLDLLIAKMIGVPDAVRAAARKLEHNSGLIVGLGFRGRRDDSKCWMYFPEDNCPFYRVTNFHNYSPHNVPGGQTDRYFSLMCETTYSAHKPVDKQAIVEDTIQGLINAGMIEPVQRHDIVSTYVIDIPYSYPVPTLERDAALQVIQPWLEANGIYSRGRFGAWKYEIGNMDHSFMQGVEVVERILGEMPERTIHGQI
jgi:protoporphyrinogen oxidase